VVRFDQLIWTPFDTPQPEHLPRQARDKQHRKSVLKAKDVLCSADVREALRQDPSVCEALQVVADSGANNALF
jgi:hypothetical protein